MEKQDDYKPAFYLSTEELKKANEWMESHDKEKHIPKGKTFRYSGAIGGAYTWCFTSTSIGTVTKLKCSCGDEIDLTDYDLW
jgi:hypothetical protein